MGVVNRPFDPSEEASIPEPLVERLKSSFTVKSASNWFLQILTGSRRVDIDSNFGRSILDNP